MENLCLENSGFPAADHEPKEIGIITKGHSRAVQVGLLHSGTAPGPHDDRIKGSVKKIVTGNYG